MKKINIGFLAFAGMIALNSCATKTATPSETPATSVETPKEITKETPEKGLDLSTFDKSVRPQDDFYNFVNGTWMKTAKIPADKSTWGSFNKLAEDTDNNSMTILNSLLNDKFAAGSEGKKIQDLYATYMDMNKRNADGISPIKADLAKIDGIKSLSDLQNYLVEATKNGENSFYAWGVFSDLKDSNMNAVYLGEANLGLGRDYYQKTNPKNTETIAEYTKYVASMLDVLGYKNATSTAQNIVNFEKSIAKNLLTIEQSRDATLQYNPKTMPELSKLVKNVDLAKYLTAVGVNTDRAIIGELKYYQNLDQIINAKNIPLIKDYMKFHLLSGSASYLSKDLDEKKFAFYGKYLRGQDVQRAQEKRGFELINGSLGEAFGKLYVEKYFPAEAKSQMVELIDYLKKSFGTHINNLTWMSPTTKEKALKKLNKFTVKVAYPDTWKDYSKLQVSAKNEVGQLKNQGYHLK